MTFRDPPTTESAVLVTRLLGAAELFPIGFYAHGTLLASIPRTEGAMSTEAIQRKTQNQFLDIPSAAYQAGYTTRDFRRIIREDRIPVVKIGQKDFVPAAALALWSSTRGEARLDESIKQLDRWLQEDARRSPEPVPSFDDME
jgi:hypothetical protein